MSCQVSSKISLSCNGGANTTSDMLHLNVSVTADSCVTFISFINYECSHILRLQQNSLLYSVSGLKIKKLRTRLTCLYTNNSVTSYIRLGASMSQTNETLNQSRFQGHK